MLIKEVEWCSIDQWYPLFKKVTFKTIILPLPNEVLEYLRSDGSLILPQECTEDENTEDEIESENDGGETEPYIKLGDGGEGAAQSSFVLAWKINPTSGTAGQKIKKSPGKKNSWRELK